MSLTIEFEDILLSSLRYVTQMFSPLINPPNVIPGTIAVPL